MFNIVHTFTRSSTGPTVTFVTNTLGHGHTSGLGCVWMVRTRSAGLYIGTGLVGVQWTSWQGRNESIHYNGVIMDNMASQITSLTIVYSTVYPGADQRKHQSSASLAFVRRIQRWPVNSPHKWPVTQKMFSFDDVIMCTKIWWYLCHVGYKKPMIHTHQVTLDISGIPIDFQWGSRKYPGQIDNFDAIDSSQLLSHIAVYWQYSISNFN